MATKSSGQLAAGPNNQRASETTSAPSSGQTQKTGTRLLLDDRPLILLPTLAALVGVDQAIVPATTALSREVDRRQRD